MAVPDTQPANMRLHPDDDLRRKDGVAYPCKFEGTYSVPEPKGLPVVQKACEQMREGKTKRKESGVKQAPIVSVHISVQGIQVFSGEEVVTRTHILKVPIEKISYIARDPADRHYLAVVYETSPPQPPEKPEFECTLFKHDVNKTREMVLTLNQAFDLAYEARIKEGKIPKVSLNEQIEIYRSRLKQLSDLLPSEKLADFLRLLNITNVTEIRGLDTGKSPQAPHGLVTQASLDVLAQQLQHPQQQQRTPPTPPVAAAAAPATPAPPKPAQPLLQTAFAAPAPVAATAAAPAQPQAELILDFGGNAWGASVPQQAPPPQQQQQLPPPQQQQALPRPAVSSTNPFGQAQPQPQPQQQQQPVAAGFGGGAFDPFFGGGFAPPPQQQQQQPGAVAGQDLMQLGFGPLDADLEFDPLKFK